MILCQFFTGGISLKISNRLPEIHESRDGKRFIMEWCETPVLETKHGAHVCREFLISKRILRKCSQIDIEEICIGLDDTTYFSITCGAKSFESHKDAHLWDFYGCPGNCHCFISPLTLRIKVGASAVLNWSSSLFGWFRSLPWQTQILIIFLIILLLAPRWVNPLLKVIETVKK